MTSSPSTSGMSAVHARYARFVVALGVVALLLGDVWRLPHLLFSRHVVCREHGELVHDHVRERSEPRGQGPHETKRRGSGREASRGGKAPLLDEAVPRGPGEPIAETARASTADALHGHEHCSSVATSARGVAIVLPPHDHVSLLAAEAGRELTSFHADAASPLTVLVYAPKQGPPV